MRRCNQCEVEFNEGQKVLTDGDGHFCCDGHCSEVFDKNRSKQLEMMPTVEWEERVFTVTRFNPGDCLVTRVAVDLKKGVPVTQMIIGISGVVPEATLKAFSGQAVSMVLTREQFVEAPKEGEGDEKENDN